LAHQVEHRGKGAGRLLARVRQPPQPGHVDVRVAQGHHPRLELADLPPSVDRVRQPARCTGDGRIEAIGAGPGEIHREKRLVQRLEDHVPPQVSLRQDAHGSEQRAGQLDEALCPLVEPHELCGAELPALRNPENSAPRLERDVDFPARQELRREPRLAVPGIEGLQRPALDIEQRLRGGFAAVGRPGEQAQRQLPIAPVRRDRDGRAKPGGEVVAAPRTAHVEVIPAAIVVLGAFRPGDGIVRERGLPELEAGNVGAAARDGSPDVPQEPFDLFDGEESHGLTLHWFYAALTHRGPVYHAIAPIDHAAPRASWADTWPMINCL
jgi:hypothetical protein